MAARMLQLLVLVVVLNHFAQSQIPAFLAVTPEEDVSVLPGHAVYIACVGIGLPPPKITWSSPTLGIPNLQSFESPNGSIVVNSNTFTDSNGNDILELSVLELCPVRHLQSVDYVCSVSNDDDGQPVGWTNATVTVTVRPVENAAVIVGHTPSTAVLLGSRVSLSCIAYGYPTPVIDWITDSSDTENINTTTVGVGNYNYTLSVLEICDISAERRSYTCIASNGLLEHEDTVIRGVTNVTIYLSPLAKTIPSVRVIAIRNFTVSLLEVRCTPDPIIELSVQWTQKFINGTEVIISPEDTLGGDYSNVSGKGPFLFEPFDTYHTLVIMDYDLSDTEAFVCHVLDLSNSVVDSSSSHFPILQVPDAVNLWANGNPVMSASNVTVYIEQNIPFLLQCLTVPGHYYPEWKIRHRFTFDLTELPQMSQDLQVTYTQNEANLTIMNSGAYAGTQFACQSQESNYTSYILLTDGALEWLPFGLPGVTTEYIDFGEVSSLVEIEYPGFPIGSSYHLYAYVWENGVITFGLNSVFADLSKPELPTTKADYLISPYWVATEQFGSGSGSGSGSDIDFTSYRYSFVSYEIHRSGYNLDAVNEFIRYQVEGASDFNGNWMLLTQWTEDLYYNTTYLYSSYQAVLITDGLKSYTVFIYQCESLDNEQGVIGYSTKDDGYSASEGLGSDVACYNNSVWTNVYYILSDRETMEDPFIEGLDYLCDFIPFGTTYGVETNYLEPYLDGSSRAIPIRGGLPMEYTVQTEAFVGTNGIISFGRPFYFWYPYRFPTFWYHIRNLYVVAPFWADSDIRDNTGTVSYEVHEKHNAYSDQFFRIINRYVQHRTGNSNFEGQWMLVAKWEHIHNYPYYFFHRYASYYQRYWWYWRYYYPRLIKTNTFSAIVITDNVESHTVFLYNCDEMEQPGFYRNGVIGFNAGGTFYDNYYLSSLSAANLVACQNIPITPCTSELYTVSLGADIIQREVAKCLAMYDDDTKKYDIVEITEIYNELDDCPCTWWQAWRDRRFWVDWPNDFFCFYSRFPGYKNATFRCCYSPYIVWYEPWGDIVTTGQRVSSIQRYHQRFNRSENDYENEFRETCCGLAKLCNLYIERRPSTFCRRYDPPAWAIMRGDPHFTTLDGKEFTFNGWGEYTLAQINDASFTLQGRTHPVTGTLNATQFVAFAFGNQESKVEINCETGSCSVLFNGTNVDHLLTEVNDTIEDSNVEILRDSENSYVTVFPNGIVVTVSNLQLPSFILNLPNSMRGEPIGLLGNFNGDINDDFTNPLGTVLNINASDSNIHEYGKTWQIIHEESLFEYPNGMGPSDYENDDTWTPVFLDEVVANAPEEVKIACGNNAQCIFDYNVTGSEEIGISTMMENEEFMTAVMQSSNFPPLLSGPANLSVKLGEEVVYRFNITEDNDDSVSPMITTNGSLPGVYSLNEIDAVDGVFYFEFRWIFTEPTTAIPQLIFAAMDSLNASGSLSPLLKVCSCLNGGTCTLDGVIGADNNVMVQNCICHPAWDGKFCENDVDGCSEIACYDGVECIDMPAPAEGAMCGPCPAGYSGDGVKCDDIDECFGNDTMHDCEQNCTNTDGSYECFCLEGYEPVPEALNLCQDIDECALGISTCEQICDNYDGGYSCDCEMGFTLDPTTGDCNPNADCGSSNNCEENCARINNVDECYCPRGFELAQDDRSCTDEDECSIYQGICEQNCINEVGSYSCTCNEGFRLLSDMRNCEDIDECADVELILQGFQACPTDFLCLNNEGSFECICSPGSILGFTIMTEGDSYTNTSSCGAIIINEVGERNYIKAVLNEITVTQFLEEGGIDEFVEIIAKAVLTYCDSNECNYIPLSESQINRDWSVQTLNIMLDVALLRSQNNVDFNFFVQVSFDGVEFILHEDDVINIAKLSTPAVESAFGMADFCVVNPNHTDTCSSTPTDLPPRSGLSPSAIIGIAVGAAAAGVLLATLTIFLYICCFTKKTPKDKGEFETMIMENIMENTAAAETDVDEGSDDKADLI